MYAGVTCPRVFCIRIFCMRVQNILPGIFCVRVQDNLHVGVKYARIFYMRVQNMDILHAGARYLTCGCKICYMWV